VSRPRLLLVGAGHAHLEILRRQALTPLPVELTVISLSPRQVYSGMVPGFLQGTYREEEISVDVARLTERAGGRLVLGAAMALDPERRIVRLSEDTEESYDLVSFAVGSNTAGIEAPEVADAWRVKPIQRVLAVREQLLALASGGSVAVVGGGAAGVEVALACAAVLGPQGRITLLDRYELLASSPDRFRRRAHSLLTARGIDVRLGQSVVRVHPDRVELADGGKVAAALTIWLTGAVAWPLFQGSGLPLDERGFLLINDSLHSLGDPRVFAAGDCGTLAAYPETPKAGVYAVREAPILWQSLRAAVHGTAPPHYRPQRSFLSILNTADGRALLLFHGFVSHSRWAWRLKDWIDRRFLGRYGSQRKVKDLAF
jgi:selenide,water dikinase